LNFSQDLTPFTEAGRERIHKQLQMDIKREISILMKFLYGGYANYYIYHFRQDVSGYNDGNEHH
jgi:hypothetical protein